jgi:hypothetical protein
MQRWLFVCLVACAPKAPDKPIAPPHDVARAETCDDMRAKVAELYRHDAQAKEPTRVDDATADNAQMVMNDCKRDPKVLPCLAQAGTVEEIEKRCLIPLDPEGSEGEGLKR